MLTRLGLHVRVKGAVSLKVALQRYGVITDDDADGTNLVNFLRWNHPTGRLQASCLVTNGLTHECWFGAWASDLLSSFIIYDDQLLILQVIA